MNRLLFPLPLVGVVAALPACESPERIIEEHRAMTTAQARRNELEIIERTLDGFHDAASKADEARYFSILAGNGVFLGTDDSERWTAREFRAYAHPFFSQGKGWTYTTRERHITLSERGDIAWFDEQLDNAKYGRCRGSGVLVLVPDAPAGGGWKIAQYNLTVPIPNDLLEGVAKQIREHQGPSDAPTPSPSNP